MSEPQPAARSVEVLADLLHDYATRSSGYIYGDECEVLVQSAQALARLAAAEKTLSDIRAILDAYTDDDGPGASFVALCKIGQRVYSEFTGV